MASAVNRNSSAGRDGSQQRLVGRSASTLSATSGNEAERTDPDPGGPSSSSNIGVCSPSSNQDTATARESLPPPPPPYSAAPGGVNHGGVFLPYFTQELPEYSEFGTPNTQARIGDIQLGFMRQAGGQYVPIQIPGYIATGPDRRGSNMQQSDSRRQIVAPPTLSPRTNERRSNNVRRHSPVPSRRRNSEVAVSSGNDYFKLTFSMLMICTLFLNVPAILMLIAALYFSVKVKDNHAIHRYAKCRRYRNIVLICNYFAVLEFIVIVLCGFSLILLVFVFNISLS